MSSNTSPTASSGEKRSLLEPSAEVSPESNKRPKKNSIEEEFVCPITLALPIDPVLASDGRIYERKAIQEHFDKNGHVSPVTKQEVEEILYPCLHVSNIIEKMIEKEEISDELSKPWKDAKALKLKVATWKEKALDGDGVSALSLGLCYQNGTCGLDSNLRIATSWYRVAAEADEVQGIALYGLCLLDSDSVEERCLGHTMIAEAAARGDGTACLALGGLYAGEMYTGDEKASTMLPPNYCQAIKFLQKGLAVEDVGIAVEGCGVFRSNEDTRKISEELLKRLLSGKENLMNLPPMNVPQITSDSDSASEEEC